jgi:acyl transferase domain-containing protein
MSAVAIVGLSCRFPGSPDAAAFWKLLCSGAKAVADVPPSRWPAHEGVPPRACLLDDISSFDAGFFRISAEEACEIDPQQRLLLEVAWEALEDAGHATDALNGSATGVFVGISMSDYRDLSVARDGPVTAFTAAGEGINFAANRISGVLGLEGPSFSVDSTCASSAAAAHLACQSLERGECDRALVGGVYLMLSRHSALGFSRLRYLSADGETRAFDAKAAGYGRGEGAGMVVLRRLDDALAAGDRIYAVICGTALRHKGRTNGLLGPSRPAQEAVLAAACRAAGVAPHQVQYVEGVGIGNPLADAMEVAALGKILGEGRPGAQPLHLGSLNANIGYLETGSGIAKLIKLALALKHRKLPATLNVEQPNPAVRWNSAGVRLHTQLSDWPRPDAPLLAGFSSFAMGGTHAHVLLKEAPAPRRQQPRPEGVLRLSARSPEALRELAGRYSAALEGPLAEAPLETVAGAATLRRMHHDERLAIAAGSRSELAQALARFAAGDRAAVAASGTYRGASAALGAQVVDGGRSADAASQTLRKLMDAGMSAPRAVLGGETAARVAQGLNLPATTTSKLKHVIDLDGGPSLIELQPQRRVLATGLDPVLAALYVLGAWQAPAGTVEAVDLPPHPWRRQTYWLGQDAKSPAAAAAPKGTLTLGDLDGLSNAARTDRVASYLQVLFSDVLEAGGTIARDVPIASVGLDSLRAVRVHQRVTLDLGFGFSLLSLLKGATVSALAEELVSTLPPAKT